MGYLKRRKEGREGRGGREIACITLIWDSSGYSQLLSNGKVTGKDRCLLLFNNMVLCASMKKRKKKGFTSRIKSEELESSTGSR